jgi:hypothetical protein
MSDSHANFKLGLLNPNTVLYDEDEEGEPIPYSPNLTSTQEYLWKLFLDGLNKTVELADGDDIIVVHNGDITHGSKHKDSLVSTRDLDELLIASSNMDPVMRMPGLKAMRFTFGTRAHVGLSGGTEQIVARDLKSRYPNINVRCYYSARITIDGATIDVSHHGPNDSIRSWLSGNLARYHLRDMIWTDLKNGVNPPSLVVRSHFHKKINEIMITDWLGKTYETRIVVTPALCMMNDYARKITRSAPYITNGMVAFEIVDGHVLPPVWFTETHDMRTKEVI